MAPRVSQATARVSSPQSSLIHSCPLAPSTPSRSFQNPRACPASPPKLLALSEGPTTASKRRKVSPKDEPPEEAPKRLPGKAKLGHAPVEVVPWARLKRSRTGRGGSSEAEEEPAPPATPTPPEAAQGRKGRSPRASAPLLIGSSGNQEFPLPTNLQCGCGCLADQVQLDLTAVSSAYTGALVAKEDDEKRRKEKAEEGQRRTHYGPAFESYAREWCQRHLRVVEEKRKKREQLQKGRASSSGAKPPKAPAGGSGKGKQKKAKKEEGAGGAGGSGGAGKDADWKVCMKGAGAILGVSMGFFYERSKRSQKSRVEEWAGDACDEEREILNVKDCCKGYDLCCVREDVNFRTSSLLGVSCCSGSPHNRQRCRLKQLLLDCPGLVQDWHDAYHMKHAERGKTRVEQRAVIGEALHAGVCRQGIRLILNSRVSSSRFQEIRVFIRNNGNMLQLQQQQPQQPPPEA